MQLVDKKVLEELAKRQAIVEAEEFSYENFTALWRKTYDTVAEDFKTEDRRIKRTYHLMKRYLKKNSPPIRFVGEGSSRSAFACDGGKCLKVAINKKGILQNNTEVKNCIKGSDEYSCFAKVYDNDKDGFTVLTECCSPIPSMKELAEQFQLDDKDLLIRVLDEIVNTFECNIDAAERLARTELEELQPITYASEKADAAFYVGVINFCKAAKHPTDPLEKVISDLIKFYTKNGKSDKALVIADLNEETNWGYAIRDGFIVPVIIDAGYSSEVMHYYYPND